MDFYEKDALAKGFKAVAGIDEAGRGPLAGPVVAAAVIFFSIPPEELGIRDSKTLSPSKREFLAFEIHKKAAGVGIGIVWPDEIDAINIHRATLKAMKLSVASLEIPPDLLLIDGSFPIDSQLCQRPIVSGDSLSVSIAAASIIAKTTRDKIMDAYHLIFPQYNFPSNKGYGTKEHIDALRTYGLSGIHRKSFRRVKE